MLTERQASYEPDIASLIDTEEEIIADDLGVSIETARRIIRMRDDHVRKEQAEVLAKVIGHLLSSSNLQVSVNALAIAFGLDELNGAHSQAEIARQLGCTRALVSFRVTGWRDLLAGAAGSFDCLKYRKTNSSRKIYADKAIDPVVQAKKRIQHERQHH